MSVSAEQANAAKGEFLANISHEIRTPLNGVMGMIELTMDTEVTAQQQEYLTLAKGASDSLLTLVDDILNYVSMQDGRCSLDAFGFALRDCLDGAFRPLLRRADAKQLTLSRYVAATVPDALVGDPGRLRQVIANLVGNAIKFTETGEVTLSVECEAEGDNTVELHFTVTDTGIGVPAEKLPAIFDPFSQADGSATRRHGGTGLGLAICAELVEMMGGRIWCESRVERGSTFHFTARFPRQVSVVGDVPPGAGGGTSLYGLPVLIAEADSTDRHILRQTLDNWQMVTAAAEDGDAIETELKRAARAGRPYALLMLGLPMPEADGFEVAQRLMQDPKTACPPVMILSSGGRRGEGPRCRELGISAYLTKPVPRPDLLAAVTAVLAPASVGMAGQLVTRHSIREGRGRRRILLLAGAPECQSQAETVLARHGYSVTVARDTGEALAALEAGPPNVIVMDVPIREGGERELTGAIRAAERAAARRTPIVALVAEDAEEDRRWCADVGMDACLPKSVAGAELIETVETLIHAADDHGDADSRPPTPGADTGRAAVLDVEQATRSVAGDMELMKEIVALFIEDSGGFLSDVRQAVEACNPERLQRAAHSLKGSVGNFGNTPAFMAAARLEAIGRDGTMDQAPAAATTLTEEMERLLPALKALADREE